MNKQVMYDLYLGQRKVRSFNSKGYTLMEFIADAERWIFDEHLGTKKQPAYTAQEWLEWLEWADKKERGVI